MTKPTTPTSSTSTGTCNSSTAAEPDTRLRGPSLPPDRQPQDTNQGHLPLSVWAVAASTESPATCPAGCCRPISGPLARHLVAACTRLGETVVHLGASDHQLVSAALTAGCLPVAVFTDAARAGVSWTCLARTHANDDLEVTELRITDPGEDSSLLADLVSSAGLVVAEQTCHRDSIGRPDVEGEVFDLANAAALVRPDGHLVVVTALHREDGVADPVPEIIARARDAGLVYLQHIVALRHPIRDGRIDTDLSRRSLAAIADLPECAGLPASARVHSDVLIFARRKRSSPFGDTATPSVGGSSTSTLIGADSIERDGGEG
ncbi:hypothetical protein [Nonomuraea sp. NPDC049709]|uniref:hypothetical protein n=1 Tax=Nonomuraea sp. NPDC049709 TaxID=3154736 RepID=UPI00342E431C